MGYSDTFGNWIRKIKGFFAGKSPDLQPKDILSRLVAELEKRKKVGIEESAFVPNVYAVYLSPIDYEELSPLLSGIKDQLKNKLLEKIKKNGYKILSTSLSIELRKDSALQKNQMVVESSFIKEKVVSSIVEPEEKKAAEVISLKDRAERPWYATSSIRQKDQLSASGAGSSMKGTSDAGVTKISEEKRTMIMDATRARLEIMKGKGNGQVIDLKEGEFTFGRGMDASILIADVDDTVSRVHFKLFVKEGQLKIKDLDSANGTKVNDIEIEEAELKKGDTISAGKVLLRVA